MLKATTGRVLFAVAGLSLTAACATHGVKSGSAVGQVGHGLSAHARSVPQGAEVCALQEALNAPAPGSPEKPVSETCNKALNSDLLYRRALIVLSAYSTKLQTVASGENAETAGQLEGSLTGVSDENWVDVESDDDKRAREAVSKLVGLMTAKDQKADLDKTIKDAAPHVKTLCTSLNTYLDAQASKFGEIRQEIEKKRASKQDRRCGASEGKTICVSESVIDRIVYANAFGDLAMQEENHYEARDDVARFCAAHAKLESAAGSGDTGKDETYAGIVDAVKAVPHTRPPRTPAPAAGPTTPDKTPATTPEKKPGAPEKNPAIAPDKKPAPPAAEKNPATAPDKK